MTEDHADNGEDVNHLLKMHKTNSNGILDEEQYFLDDHEGDDLNLDADFMQEEEEKSEYAGQAPPKRSDTPKNGFPEVTKPVLKSGAVANTKSRRPLGNLGNTPMVESSTSEAENLVKKIFQEGELH